MKPVEQKHQPMNRKVKAIIILVILGLGLIITSLLISSYYRSEINNLMTDFNAELKKTVAQFDQNLANNEDELQRAKAENKNLLNQIDQLKNQVSQLTDRPNEVQAGLVGESTDLEQQIIDSSANQSSMVSEPPTLAPSAPTNEQRAQSEERMREDLNRKRSILINDLNREMQETSDPAIQNRLAQIQEYTDYNIDLLFQQLSSATTDEQRETAYQQMSNNQKYLSTLRQELQNYKLGEVGKKYGVSSSEQANFINSLREVMDNPLFIVDEGEWSW